MKTPGWHFNADLQEVPDNVEEWEAYLALYEALLSATRDPEEIIKFSAEAGLAARLLRRLDVAQAHFERGLRETQRASDKARTVGAYLRLAHVYQWKKDFREAHRLFAEAEALLNDRGLFAGLRAFFHQHRGKCSFDEENYAAAEADFARALALREDRHPIPDLVTSSKSALAETRRRLLLQKS